MPAQTLNSGLDEVELAIVNGIALRIVVDDIAQVARFNVDQAICPAPKSPPNITADGCIEDAPAFLIKKFFDIRSPSGKADPQGNLGSYQHGMNRSASSVIARW